MEFFRIRKVIPFMRYARMLNIISAVTFALAVLFLVTRGLHLSVEFTGGTLMEVTYAQSAPLDTVRGAIEQMGYKDVVVQNYGSSQEVLIRLPLQQGVTSVQQSSQVMDALKAQDGSVSLRRVEFIGPQVGKELLGNGIKALAFVVIGIIIYLALRFEWKYAVSAIVANLHDIIIILGFFAFFQWEVSLSVLAAVLAVLGYSVNESVVVFDRVRENFRHFRKMGTVDVINHAITSTTSRTIITHGSTLMMVLSMQLFGGETLHYFAVALTIGILFGIYSSVFVATSMAMWLGIRREDLIKKGAAPAAAWVPARTTQTLGRWCNQGGLPVFMTSAGYTSGVRRQLRAKVVHAVVRCDDGVAVGRIRGCHCGWWRVDPCARPI